MNPTISFPASTSIDFPKTGEQGKALRAAHDFEAILFETLLRPLQQTFSSLPGGPTDAGADNYHYLGTEALASALARSGGLGIARTLTGNLLKPGH